MTDDLGSRDDDLAELYEDAPCGYLSTSPDGTIVRVNRTFLGLTGHVEAELLAGRRFVELLTAAGRMLYETHCAPLLRLQGFVGEVALDVRCRDERSLPVLFSSAVKRGEDGAPRVIRSVVLHAPTRREYEREILRARREAEASAEQLRVQAELLAAHSALLIPVQDDLRVMPILGAIDPARGRQILRALLELDGATGVRAVILDLTGVPSLDAAAAGTLRSAAAALRLLGVRPIVTGIRPAVAAALVAHGIELPGITVSGTLQDGIALANRGERGRPRR